MLVRLESDRDNTLYEDAGGQQSNGAGEFMFAGITNQPGLRRALIHFDVAGAAIPAGSTIDSVTLTLNLSRTNTGATPVALHRVTADWGQCVTCLPRVRLDRWSLVYRGSERYRSALKRHDSWPMPRRSVIFVTLYSWRFNCW